MGIHSSSFYRCSQELGDFRCWSSTSDLQGLEKSFIKGLDGPSSLRKYLQNKWQALCQMMEIQKQVRLVVIVEQLSLVEDTKIQPSFLNKQSSIVASLQLISRILNKLNLTVFASVLFAVMIRFSEVFILSTILDIETPVDSYIFQLRSHKTIGVKKSVIPSFFKDPQIRKTMIYT